MGSAVCDVSLRAHDHVVPAAGETKASGKNRRQMVRHCQDAGPATDARIDDSDERSAKAQ